MLQDALAARPVELDAILGTLLETAAALQVPAPHLQAVHALARAHARAAGLLPPTPRTPRTPPTPSETQPCP
jgi:2-dehydropantoate 2-reductase